MNSTVDCGYICFPLHCLHLPNANVTQYGCSIADCECFHSDGELIYALQMAWQILQYYLFFSPPIFINCVFIVGSEQRRISSGGTDRWDRGANQKA